MVSDRWLRLISNVWLGLIGFFLLPFVLAALLVGKLASPEFVAGMTAGILLWLWLDLMVI